MKGAAELRISQQNSKGIQNGGGNLAKKLEYEKSRRGTTSP